MSQNQQATLNQAIKLLQSLLSNQGSGAIEQSALADISIPEYDTQIQVFYSKGSSLQPQLQKLTELFKKASQSMKLILNYSQICKKYSTGQQQKLKNIFISLSNDIQAIIKKNPQFVDQCKAMKQILSATFWVFVPTPQFIIKGAVQGADFNALKFQKKKNQDHNQWWASVTGACKALQKFVVKQYPTGLNFKFNGQDKWDSIISGTVSSAPTKPTVTGNQAQNLQKPQQNITIQKVPNKHILGQNWHYSNYNSQALTIQVQMKHNIFIENCTKCVIKIPSKFKSLNLNKCTDITLEVNSCVSGLEFMNSKNVTLIVKEKTPSISVDKSQKVKIILNQNNLETDIVSCKASELNVSYQNNQGEQSKAHLISDQLLTKWNPKTKKFQTSIYGMFL